MGRENGWCTLEQAKWMVEQIVNFSTHNFRVYNLFGGEPTLWKWFSELCMYIKRTDKNSVIQVLTNGSRTIRWWKKYSPYMDDIVISHHHLLSDPDHVINVVNECYPYSRVSVQVLMDIASFDKCRDHFNYMMVNLPGIAISAKKGETNLGSKEWMPYTLEQNTWFQESLKQSRENSTLQAAHTKLNKMPFSRSFQASDGNSEWAISNKELIFNDLNHFKDWKCNIGMDKISIKSNGMINPGSACYPEWSIGNYKLKTEIKWPINPITCKYDTCYCGADIEIEKHDSTI